MNSNVKVNSIPSSEGILFSIGRFCFRYRNQMFPIMFSIIFLLTSAGTHVQTRTSIIVSALGVAIALMGQLYRLLVIGYAYIRRGGLKGEVYADHLVIEGLYAHSRNPMYFGNILIAVGFSLVFNSIPVAAAVIPIFLLIYYSIVLVEEGYLREKFGQAYLDYEARVPRFVPSAKRVLVTLKGARYDWRTALIKEYGTLCGTLAGLIFILSWQRFQENPASFFSSRAGTFFAVSELAVLVFYASIRRIKKTEQRRERAIEAKNSGLSARNE